MARPLDIRRHPDGSIDFDFYRRRATRQRQFARRAVLRYCLILVGRALRGTILAFERPVIGS
jgi:hypothetical protein